ncbi:aldehyde dehydrogenase family protein [Phenylobacterium sp.]|uniref:aldehyde dehydrogenase family protein n=1 Tax=Phenylobacterium sp. TaxID=1871053 RepID=UPI0037CB83B0
MRRLAARNPRTGALDFSFEVTAAPAVVEATSRARRAQPAWAALGFAGRASVMARFAAELTARRETIQAALETDTGRRRISGQEIDSVIGAIAGWSAMAPTLMPEGWVDGRAMPAVRHAPNWRPYALVGVISPWNFPMLLGMIDAVPALTAGCAVIVKPSEVTPRFVGPLRDAIAATPGLEAVLQILPGDGETGQALIDEVDCICFTGSVATGRKVALQAAGRLIPAFLELGGKDPLIVLADADLEAATDAALRGSVLSTGQACQSIERIYVQRGIYGAVVERLTMKANAVGLNWPQIDSGEVGPIIFARQAEILAAQIADAQAKGARVLAGGEIEHHGGGLWLRPTVLVDVTHEMAVMRDETFGPILPIMAFDTLDEAVALANFGEFGLSAAVFAGTLEAAEAVGRRLDAGAISLNDAALTAVFYEAAKQSFKASGVGPSRMGADGLARFFRRQALIANTGQPLPLSAFRESS